MKATRREPQQADPWVAEADAVVTGKRDSVLAFPSERETRVIGMRSNQHVRCRQAMIYIEEFAQRKPDAQVAAPAATPRRAPAKAKATGQKGLW